MAYKVTLKVKGHQELTIPISSHKISGGLLWITTGRKTFHYRICDVTEFTVHKSSR